MNLCPEIDFERKLASWQVFQGPEFERAYIATVRQAIVDRDRLQDASLVMRDADGAITAICAAQQAAPFVRRKFAIDFYCVPELLASAEGSIRDLVEQTIARIDTAPDAPHPCRLSYIGVDEAKCRLFESLGFSATGAEIGAENLDQQGRSRARQFTRILK